jgi:hypothetical protein
MSAPGRAGKIESLMLVLKGNNPRFPWGALHHHAQIQAETALERGRRLTGADATSLIADQARDQEAHEWSAATVNRVDTIFARHGEPNRALFCSDPKSLHDRCGHPGHMKC